jgi:hypothetical protein
MIRVVRTPSLATIPRRLALFLLATMVIAAGCGASDESATERRGVDDQVESTTTDPASDQAADGQTADGQTAGGQSGGVDEPVGEDTTATTDGQAEQTAEATPVDESILSRRDQTPPGVERQFEFFNIGNGPCAEFDANDAPFVTASPGSSVVLGSFLICLPGFDPALPMSVTLTSPAGGTTEFESFEVYQEVPYVIYTVPLYSDTGVFNITARQGDVMSDASVTIEQPQAPRLLLPGRTSGQRGDSFTIHFAGFQPGEGPRFNVYVGSGTDGTFEYVTTIAAPAADALGRSEYVLTTSEADAPGVYCFIEHQSEFLACPSGRVVKIS